MLEFFQKIIDYISLGFGLLLNLVNGLWQFLKMIPQILLFTGSVSAFVPSFAIAFFIAGITASIVLVIIGRKS